MFRNIQILMMALGFNVLVHASARAAEPSTTVLAPPPTVSPTAPNPPAPVVTPTVVTTVASPEAAKKGGAPAPTLTPKPRQGAKANAASAEIGTAVPAGGGGDLTAPTPATVATAGAAPSSAPISALSSAGPAGTAGPWTWSLSARTRYENGSQFNLIDHRQFNSIRVRSLVTYSGFDRVKIALEPQYNKSWGIEPYVPESSAKSAPINSSGNHLYTGSMDALVFRSAYLDVQVAPGLNALLGRQILAYGDQFIIGPMDWGLYSRSFDAARLRYVWRDLQLEAVRAKIVDTQNTTAKNGEDRTLDGLYFTYAPNKFVKAFELYNFWLRDEQTKTADPVDQTRPWQYGTRGTRLVLGAGAWTAKAELAQNFGPSERGAVNPERNTEMFDGRTDYQFGGRLPQKLGLQLYRAGENFRELFPTPFEAFGRTDLLGRRNVTGGALHLTSNWTDKLITGVDWLYFRRVGQGSSAFQPDGIKAIGAKDAPQMDLGSEVDVTARYAVTKQITIGAGAAVYFVGDYFKDAAGGKRKTPSYEYVMMELKP